MSGELPSVAGRMEMTHESFQHACAVALRDLQDNPNCDTHLVFLICEAVRCSRECCDIATINLGCRVQRLDGMSQLTTATTLIRRVLQSCGELRTDDNRHLYNELREFVGLKKEL